MIRLFLVLLTYKTSLSEVDKHLENHIHFLERQYEKKKFIFSGRKNPRNGGVILVRSASIEEVKAIMAQDPFYQNDVADYEYIEFTPTKYDESFAVYVEE